jgi:hypothetical protein
MDKENFETFEAFRDRHFAPKQGKVNKSKDEILSEIEKIRKGKAI